MQYADIYRIGPIGIMFGNIRMIYYHQTTGVYYKIKLWHSSEKIRDSR